MGVHSRAVVAKDGFGHKGCRFAVAARDVLNYVLKPHLFIGDFEHLVEAEIDFALAGCGDFVVLTFNFDAEFVEF